MVASGEATITPVVGRWASQGGGARIRIRALSESGVEVGCWDALCWRCQCQPTARLMQLPEWTDGLAMARADELLVGGRSTSHMTHPTNSTPDDKIRCLESQPQLPLGMWLSTKACSGLAGWVRPAETHSALRCVDTTAAAPTELLWPAWGWRQTECQGSSGRRGQHCYQTKPRPASPGRSHVSPASFLPPVRLARASTPPLWRPALTICAGN
jgi:hypothetical protein